MPSVVMLIVVAQVLQAGRLPTLSSNIKLGCWVSHFSSCCAECHYAECRYAYRRGADSLTPKDHHTAKMCFSVTNALAYYARAAIVLWGGWQMGSISWTPFWFLWKMVDDTQIEFNWPAPLLLRLWCKWLQNIRPYYKTFFLHCWRRGHIS